MKLPKKHNSHFEFFSPTIPLVSHMWWRLVVNDVAEDDQNMILNDATPRGTFRLKTRVEVGHKGSVHLHEGQNTREHFSVCCACAIVRQEGKARRDCPLVNRSRMVSLDKKLS